MADKRINALTTTSASVGDDYFAIDGATNGTRALSAFSPTFGGNATVGGTLTVSGATMSVGGGSGSIVSALDGTAGNYKLHLFRSGGVDRWYCGLQAATETGSNAGAPFGITALSDAGAQIDVPLQITRAAGGAVTIVRPTAITNTTASTSTSSGALVVSGGVGVAGAVYSAGLFGNAVDVSSNPVTFASSGGCVMSYSGSGVGVIRPYANGSGAGTSSLQLRPSGTLAVTVSASTVELAGGIDLKLGNAYTAGAPTATGYIVIKDSTGTSYKIPAVAL